MKFSTFLSLLVLLLALSTKPLLGSTGPTPKEVIDTSGKKLRAGTGYYIIPASLDHVSGLDLTSTGKVCPQDVAAVYGFRGPLLVFTPVNPKKGVIRVDTDLNIYFSTERRCPNSNVWKVGDYDSTAGQWFVTTGGVLGNPGSQTIGNWFKIEKYEDAYKLVYCPSVCNSCNHLCRDLGIYEDQYGSRLALTDVPYKVRFLHF